MTITPIGRYYLNEMKANLERAKALRSNTDGLSITARTVRQYMNSPEGQTHPIPGPHLCSRCHYSNCCSDRGKVEPRECDRYIPIRPAPGQAQSVTPISQSIKNSARKKPMNRQAIVKRNHSNFAQRDVVLVTEYDPDDGICQVEKDGEIGFIPLEFLLISEPVPEADHENSLPF